MPLRFQRVAATQASNFSAGVWYCKVFLGRSLSWRATALSLAWLKPDISRPFGKYWRRSRLVFSLLPRCHGDWGLGIAKVHVDFGRHGELAVPGHLRPTVPGQ